MLPLPLSDFSIPYCFVSHRRCLRLIRWSGTRTRARRGVLGAGLSTPVCPRFDLVRPNCMTDDAGSGSIVIVRSGVGDGAIPLAVGEVVRDERKVPAWARAARHCSSRGARFAN